MAQIDPYEFKYPPDYDKCTQHHLATRVFKGLEDDDSNNECQCCSRKIGVQSAEGSCCYSNLQLCFLGPGIPLLFSYILYCIITLIILSAIFSLFALITNALGGDCSELPDCSGNIFNTLSIVNKINKNDYLSVQNYVLLAFVFVFSIVMHLYRRSFRKIEQQCDQRVDSPSDYAIILRRLPEDITKEDIQEMINEYKGYLDDDQKKATQNLRVVNIILSYNLDDYIKAKEENMTNFKEFIKQYNPENFQPDPLPKPTQTASIAIVVFAKQQAKDLFVYKPNICQKILQCFCEPCVPKSDFVINGEQISVQRAPEPDDIVWPNAQVFLSSAVCRKIVFNLLSLCLLVAGGAAQYGLARAQEGEDNERIKLIYSAGSSIVVAVMNRIIQQFLVFTSKMQKNETITQFNRVLMIKISFFLFLNSGVFLVAANIIGDTSGYKLQGNLSYEITLIMILNAITPNAGVFFAETLNLPGKIKIFLLKKDCFKLTQRQANKFYEGSYPQIPFKYGYVIKTIWLTAFYAPLVPLVVPISIFGLIFNYWLEKYSYGKKYAAPNMISSLVNDAAIELLEWVPLILSLGQFGLYLYFKNFSFGELPDYWSIPLYISIAISVAALFLPMRQINKRIFKLHSDQIDYPPYESVQDRFQVTYQMTNPAYHCERRRKRDRNIWGILFASNNDRPYFQKELNPLHQAFLGKVQQPPQPPPGLIGNNNNNPFNMINMNQNIGEYPTIDPVYGNQNNNFENTGYPFIPDRNL